MKDINSNVLIKIGLFLTALCLLLTRFLSGNLPTFFAGLFAGVGVVCYIAAFIKMKSV